MTDPVDPVELLRKLIRCESITPQQAGALDLLQEILSSAGFATERMPSGEVDNLWALCGEKPHLIFAGHVDVVPPGDLSQWQSPPFEPSLRGGFLYGRGAADMKSGVAAMTAAAVRAAKENRANGLALLFTSDEEGPAKEGTAHVVRVLKERGIKAQRCIVGEPTCENEFGDAIKIARRGSLSASITVAGKQAHAAYPHRGENPVPAFISALNELCETFGINEKAPADNGNAAGKNKTPEFPPRTFQIVKLQSGVAENVIPPFARATINFRYPPGDSTQTIIAETEKALQKTAAGKYKCEWRNTAVPFSTDPSAPLVKALRETIMEVAKPKTPPRASAGGGASDGRFLREICKELAEFGVMNEGIHEPNERVRPQDVAMLAEIYHQITRRFLPPTSG